MRKVIAILVAAVSLATFASSASAGDRYYERRQSDRTAEVVVGAGLALLGLAIIAGNQQPAPRYHQSPYPRYTYQPRMNRYGTYQRQQVVVVPSGCFYPRPGVYYNMRQDIDSTGRIVVCP